MLPHMCLRRAGQHALAVLAAVLQVGAHVRAVIAVVASLPGALAAGPNVLVEVVRGPAGVRERPVVRAGVGREGGVRHAGEPTAGVQLLDAVLQRQ